MRAVGFEFALSVDEERSQYGDRDADLNPGGRGQAPRGVGRFDRAHALTLGRSCRGTRFGDVRACVEWRETATDERNEGHPIAELWGEKRERGTSSPLGVSGDDYSIFREFPRILGVDRRRLAQKSLRMRPAISSGRSEVMDINRLGLPLFEC